MKKIKRPDDVAYDLGWEAGANVAMLQTFDPNPYPPAQALESDAWKWGFDRGYASTRHEPGFSDPDFDDRDDWRDDE